MIQAARGKLWTLSRRVCGGCRPLLSLDSLAWPGVCSVCSDWEYFTELAISVENNYSFLNNDFTPLSTFNTTFTF